MARVIAFDVNETLLDLRALDPDFVHIFGEASTRREWFSQMIQSTLVATVTGEYADFGSIGIAALEMLAERHAIVLKERPTGSVSGMVCSISHLILKYVTLWSDYATQV